MRLTEALHSLGRPVAYFPALARCLGSVPAALFVAQLVYWNDKQLRTYLYKTSAQLEEEIGLSAKAQRTARAILRRLGILHEKYARLQHEMHFELDFDRLNEVWSEWEKAEGTRPKSVSRTAQTSLREAPKGRIANRQKGASIPETTQRPRREVVP